MNTLEKYLKLRTFINDIERRGLVYGASFSEFVILRTITEEGSSGVRRVDLADTVGMSISGVTRALAPLEKLGYIQKLDQALDARVRRVGLTESGSQLYADILSDVQARLERSTADLDQLLQSIATMK
ncbi:MAG: MarR family transcriptional regulator [Aquiluna sp.]|nr:MarR family transcriptional regulator [Aquiluna sp.]MCF8546160.1 MarR family transcriptional regulator [Aquiluna sp.]